MQLDVSSQRSSVIWRNYCTGGLGNLMFLVSLAPLTWCGLSLGLVGAQHLDESQMRTESADDRCKLSELLNLGLLLFQTPSDF